MHRWFSGIALLLLLCSPTVSSTGFRKVAEHINAAHDKAFHDALLQQLAKSRSNGSVTDALKSSLLSEPDLVPAVATNLTGSTTDEFTSSFQIYNNDNLPTSPAPSTQCAAALTATVGCNSTVLLMGSYPNALFNDLPIICTTQCATSLSTYRSKVASACQGFQISTSNNISYVPTLAADSITGPYTVECLQDPTSGQFCAPLLASFNSSAGLLSLSNSQLCTYCPLKTLNATLSTPGTYSYPLAQLLSSAIKRCGSQFASYNVTHPPSNTGGSISSPPFGTNATTNPTIACAIVGHNISVTADTTCSSIATANSITISSILSTNPFLVGTSDCSVKSGTKLCLLQKCSLYKVAANDTCDSIAAQSASLTGTKITATQLQSFNPDLGTSCQLLSSKIGTNICLTPNGGFPNVSVSIGNDNIPSGTPTTFAAVPTPTVDGTTSNCGRYYQVKQGDVCNTVVLANSISLADFLTLNPEIDANCTNLWLNYYYCVAPYPPLSSTSAPPVVTSNYTRASIFTYSLPTSYTPSMVTLTFPTQGAPVPANVATGTRTVWCGYYYTVAAGDTMESMATKWHLNSTALTTWNPELASSAPTPGQAICVVFPTGNYTLPTASIPSNLASNVNTSTCAQYYTIVSGDTCTSIEQTFLISDAEFKAINRGINAQCTNIVLGLAYCVLSTAPPDTTSTPSGPPGNVASGTITDGCTGYYTVASVDSCATIESKYNLTLAQFITMNPEINLGCTNLALAEAYCVASSNSSSGTGPPGNVAPGTITAGCTEYYTIVSGDGCASIESKFELTLAQLIAMNPELNSGCTNLALGEAYCVASSNSTSSGPPANLAVGSLGNCTSYHTVASGDTCTAIDASAHIALADFLRWNPEVNAACTNIELGSAYCVSGGGAACAKVYTVVSGDSCAGIVKSQGVAQARLNALNPQINADCSNLGVGENLCIG
ncbi:hypothetical protein R3P38DRAFT_3003090 [Favolaschia claudopus]|uniref:LysM domain-containing protein n=1 Tax=Favolaschia claudopus TaxID=2862362 RepID=A0AAW0AMU0_9AGAR